MSQANLDICSISTFASMCGASIDDVLVWMNTRTIPSVKVSDFRMVNIAKIKADLDAGKSSFNEGDYDDE
jgi:hypothetical protein